MTDIKITPILESLKIEKIDDSKYFSEKYSNYISNSRMGLIYDWDTKRVTAERFFEGFKPLYSSSLDIGTAVHSMCLQKELFNIVDLVDKPTGKMGAMAEELFEIWHGSIPTAKDILEVAKKIDYYGGKLSPKRIEEVKTKCRDFWITKNRHLRTRGEDPRVDLYLDPRSRETSYACIRAIENNKNIQDLLKPKSDFGEIISDNEQAILLDIRIDMPDTQPFILKLKAKLDNYSIDPLSNTICVNDIKTLGRILSDFQINVDKYHYNREISFYSFLLGLVAKKHYNIDEPTVKGNYLVVSTIPDYYTKVVAMTKKDFIQGWNEVKFLLRIIAKEVATNYKDFAEWI